jgi:16S rRNA (guanine527-N7)-methyltransferase
VEHERDLREFLVTSTKALGISLTEQQSQQFLVYLSQLLTWNRTTNLTSITDPHEIIGKHFVDSLTALNAFMFPFQGVIVDVGSGAGFPGIPLKIVRNDIRVVLVEPSLKKCSFLHSIVGTLKLEQVSIFSGGLEEYAAQKPRPLVDAVLVRALRMDEIAESSALILNESGRLLLYRTGKRDERPLKAFRWESSHDFSLPRNYGHRVVTVLKKADS